MRRFGSLFVIVVTMALLHRLTASAPLPARAVLALAFLVVVGLVLGALAEAFGVRAASAYVVAGFVFGPSWLGLVRADEIGALGFTNDLVLAAVALLAGASLRFDALSLQRRPLARFLAATAVVPGVLVAVTVAALAHWFPPTAHEPFGDLLLVALVVGASAVASSPTLTVATTGAEEDFAQTLLGANAARDVIVAVLFAAILIAAPLVASPGSYDPHGALRPLLLLLGSVVAGLAVALGGAQLARMGRFPPLLPPLLAAGIIGLLARLGHIDPVFTGLVAGLCLVLWAGPGWLSRGLAGPFEPVRIPLFAAAFGLLGAGLDLTDTSGMWGWVLLVVLVRGVGLYLGDRWTRRGAEGDVPPGLARYGWMGLISQSGFILWLSAEARHAFPEWGVSLQALIVGVVAVNAMVGPFALQRGKLLAGDSTQRSG